MIKVERESRKWREQYIEANKTLIGVLAQKKEAEDSLAQKDRQLENLQKLCRTLQDQRADLLKQLKRSPVADVEGPLTTSPDDETTPTD